MTKMNELDLCMRSYQLKVMPTIAAPHSPVNISETVIRPRDKGLVGSKRSPIGNGLYGESKSRDRRRDVTPKGWVYAPVGIKKTLIPAATHALNIQQVGYGVRYHVNNGYD